MNDSASRSVRQDSSIAKQRFLGSEFLPIFFSVKGAYLSPAIYIPVK